LRQAVKKALSATLPRSLFLVRGPSCVERRATGAPAAEKVPAVALTFGDGPDGVHTPRLLDRLRAARIKATFFVIGECAARHPQILRRMRAEGHELGNHTYTHAEPDRISPQAFIDEVRRTRALLEELTGEVFDLVRPPYGELTLSKALGLLGEGQTIVLWNVEPRDHAMSSLELARRWARTYRPASGDIVLLHNGPMGSAIVEELAGRAASEEMSFVTISQYISTGREEGWVPIY